MSNDGVAQDSSDYRDVYPSGLELQGGGGFLALRDDHISNEKYSGSSSCFGLHWSKFHESFGYRIGMSFQKASGIKNHNVSAEVVIGSFDLVYQYPIGTFSLFSKKAWASLGPGTEILFLTRNQNIARNPSSEQDVYQSGAWLFSLGIRGDVILPITEIFRTESSLQFSLVSLGGGSGGISKITETMKWLTIFSALHTCAEIGVRYFPVKWFSIKAGYAFDVIRIDSWNYLIAGIDKISLSIGYHPF